MLHRMIASFTWVHFDLISSWMQLLLRVVPKYLNWPTLLKHSLPILMWWWAHVHVCVFVISYHLFSFHGSLQDCKIHRGTEIASTVHKSKKIFPYKVQHWSQYKSVQQFQLIGLVWCLRIKHNINNFNITHNSIKTPIKRIQYLLDKNNLLHHSTTDKN